MTQMLMVMFLLAAVPLMLFFGVVGLAIFIWCWRSIGRYFINLGRWLGSWRNFIPLSILGILSLILMVVILPIIGVPRTLLAVLLVLLLVATIVIFLFALVAWTLRFCEWFWPPYRKLVWSAVSSMWGVLPQSSGKSRRRVFKPSDGPTPDGQPTAGRQPPKKRSMLGNFWALMLGKPSKQAKPKSKTKPVTVQTTEQSLGQSESIAATAKTGATTRVVETSTSPKADKKEKPKRRGVWASIVGSITFVVGLVFLGVVWVVQKIREGIEWIRVRLNLD